MSRKSYPNVNAANQYARDVVRGKIVACQFVIQACQRHLDDLMAEKSKSFRYRFDKDLAERAAKFIQLLPHTKGEWAFKRMPITLEPWQLFVICCAFGWVNKGSRLRRFREVYTEIPRKNGKSAISAGVALYCFACDNEFGAEVYSGATTEKQAWEVFRPARLMCKRTPMLTEAFGIEVNDTNMLSFFTKTSSVLKMVNKDGLQAAQSLAPISVMMDQMGMNGESAGNALRKVIQSGLSVKKIRDVNKIMARQKLGVQLDFTDGKGSFGGLDNMFRQLAKLRKLTDVKRTGVLKAIFGDDAETLQVVNALIDKGKDGYDQIQQKMNKQASLNKRVQAQLGTLSNLWEAMTGTATNGLAAIGGAFSGDAKNITQWLGELGEKFTKFADENPRVIRGVVGLAAGLAILKLGLMGVGGAISIVSRIMSMTPIGMIATAIALAAGLIITNWDVVGPYFKKLWETIGPYFEAGWELLKKVFAWSPLGMVINNWGPVVKWFQDMWDKLKPIIEWFTDSSGDTVDAINSAQWGAGAYDAYGTGIPARGYTPYPAVDLAQSNNASDATGPNPFMINKAIAPKVDGEIKVSFMNMPPGMRVTETRSSGIDINHDVGYTRFR
ncbi:phage tail tape measure protein [Escherichia coli]|uniref:phage tail tape measure protein n=1 Tax=Escherichia coli TaxID=562 RepID=UPI00110A3D10|nr:phage tail tape measure protein [Escherichia coli]EFH5211523.1 phage tail tape measure protein [Escherichia coli]EHI0878260.1 phage tail tape measure protein [Escherichia coli]ELA5619145.1 phage tail tape measure protein [Escherichia coli]TMR20120.1 phage tail tape measure protein [Escherichia coli]HEI3230947.1 phage tail tape measure protein [Escherichia coli]